MPEYIGTQPGYDDPDVKTKTVIREGAEPEYKGVQPGQEEPTLIGYIRKRIADLR